MDIGQARLLIPFEEALDDGQIGLALLGLGLLQPSASRYEDIQSAVEAVETKLDRAPGHVKPWAWRWRPSLVSLVQEAADANKLVSLGQSFLSADHSILGPRLEASPVTQIDSVSLVKVLRSTGATVYLQWPASGDITWRWPIRIASVPSLMELVASSSSIDRLVEHTSIYSPTLRVQIACIEQSLAEAHQMLTDSLSPMQGDLVVILGGIGMPLEEVQEQVIKIREQTNSDAVFVCEGVNNAKAFILELIEQLSHDHPVDVALEQAAQSQQACPILFSTRRLIHVSRVSKQAESIVRRIENINRPIYLPEATALKIDSVFEPNAQGRFRIRAADMVNVLEERVIRPNRDFTYGHAEFTPGLPPFIFDRESAGATVMADIAEAVEQAESAADSRHKRFLQTQINTPGGTPIDRSMPLRSKRGYVAAVFIGASRDGWLGLGQPVNEPQLDSDASFIELDVLFLEPSADKEPQRQSIRLPRFGDSEPVLFTFNTGSNDKFTARIAVYHRDRNLQTGLLTANVGDGPCELVFKLDAIPTPQFEGLDSRGSVGGSILLSHNDNSGMQAVVRSRGQVTVTSISDETPTIGVVGNHNSLGDLVEALGWAITQIARRPDEYLSLSTEGNRILLRDLALHGGALLRRLKKHTQLGDQFDRLEYIQVVRADAEAFFPIEFLYTGAIPEDDAIICGCLDNPDDIPSVCKESEEKPEHTICPLKFWSLSKVIERHAHLPDHTRLDAAFELRAGSPLSRERMLDVLDSALLAASDRVDAAVPLTLKGVHDSLSGVVRRRPVPDCPQDWVAWEEAIAQNSPTLLVMLPHHTRQARFDVLEIGNGQGRKTVQIGEKHVRPSGENVHPVVLLIGCETAQARIESENAVIAFQDAGAAIVVCTVATILGRQAGPVTQALIEELDNLYGQSDATFGMAMRQLRRRLLAEGTAMVLGLTSYGDADWRIGREALTGNSNAPYQ